ncbi:hypothetical protein [Streptomyces sp. KR80]|uniref:hypothetical protein n=1 Tax=Streptomyces sp. KR80 TaxID=3457426 RepID=UPI003FD43F53
MGIESDKLVYDYLSRVGDLAQQRQLPSSERMRLVTRLRSEIEQQRAGATDTPAAVRRILGRLGTPADVVDSAGTDGSGARTAREQSAGLAQRATARGGTVPAPRKERGTDAGAGPVPEGPSPPHLAGEDELGPFDDAPDWWRMAPGPFGGTGQPVHGFVGGIEIPEILRPPPGDEPPGDEQVGQDRRDDGADQGPDAAEAVGKATLLRRALRRRVRTAGAVVPRTPRSPLLLIAAALLVAGAFLGSMVTLGLGWLIAYGSRRLSRIEAKLAALGLPGMVAVGAIVWLWGRVDGRWGEPIPQGRMADALTGTWPVALRVAAVASALFLVWKARRRPTR